MKIRIIDEEFSVLITKNFKNINFDSKFYFACKTDREYSLVTKTSDAPNDCLDREDGWRAMAIDSQLDFSLVGVLSKICDALSRKGVALFAVSTYDTDYVLVKKEKLETAVQALTDSRFEVY